ncbi:transcriptional repressor [Rhodoplanes roseus]|uniref:Ferric uptake regulation protein n=1 Tax=Rhodoplanes roseus TaxID=29409 RepID=A0A327KV25_9BRAD|nr:transcriptional repressor [Rhodoplanes roseus]RAI41112.1 transcriptional repressor [Rhodoplanes roseus]
MPEVFPSPDHDHARCSASVLAHAETLCKERQERLTPMRRQVLSVLAGSHKPLGAYEILEMVVPEGPRPAPITVYRALDFLIAQGLVHRIESRNAFLACSHSHATGARVAFLICERCGAVGEAPAAGIADAIAAAAETMGFTPKISVIEVTGVCAHCAGA